MPAGRKRSFDREAALDAAMNAFWAKGFDATTYGDLVAATGVNPPSLYAAFGDKGAFFEAVLQRYVDSRAAPAVQQIMEGKGSTRKVIGDWLRATADSMTDEGHPPGCFLTQAHTDSGVAPDRCTVAGIYLDRFEEALRHRLKTAMKAGELPPDTDPPGVARALLAVNLGMGAMARKGATRKELRQVAESATTMVPAPTKE